MRRIGQLGYKNIFICVGSIIFTIGLRGRRGLDHIINLITTTYAIRVYYH